VRFDGARFVTLTTNAEPALQDNHISCLLVDSNGVLWIGTQKGTLARRLSGSFVQVVMDPRLHDAPINALQSAPAGGLWLSTSGSGLVRLKDGVWDFSTPTNGLWQADVANLVLEEQGHLWVVSDTNLMMLDQGRWHIAPGGPDETTPTYAVARSVGDAAWIATSSTNDYRDRGGRVFQIAGMPPFKELAPYPWSQDSQRTRIRSILRDRSNRVWVGTVGDGVFYWTSGAGWQRLVSTVDQPDEDVPVMMEDGEGLIWMASSQSTLYQVRKRYVSSLRLSAGEANIRVISVCAANDGDVWVGTDDAGVFLLSHDLLTQFTNGLASLHVHSVFVDSRRNLWVGSLNGLYRWEKTRFVQRVLPEPSTSPVNAL
jgi:ligand-binding sensor domain-containing protein